MVSGLVREHGSGSFVSRLARIFSKILDVPADRFADTVSIHTVAGWDSLKHVQLMLAIEEEFDLSLAPEDIETMVSVGLIKEVLQERGVLLP